MKKMVRFDSPQQRQHGIPAMLITGIILVPTLFVGVFVIQSQSFGLASKRTIWQNNEWYCPDKVLVSVKKK